MLTAFCYYFGGKDLEKFKIVKTNFLGPPFYLRAKPGAQNQSAPPIEKQQLFFALYYQNRTYNK